MSTIRVVEKQNNVTKELEYVVQKKFFFNLFWLDCYFKKESAVGETIVDITKRQIKLFCCNIKSKIQSRF